MRHRLKSTKLGRSSSHRAALVSALVCALIEQRKIRTTLQKARVARGLAESMVTLAKKGSADPRMKSNAWRNAVSVLHRKTIVNALFDQVVPACKDRVGGYTRITKLDRRGSDGAEMAILEWVNLAPPERKKKKTDSQADKTDKTEKKA